MKGMSGPPGPEVLPPLHDSSALGCWLLAQAEGLQGDAALVRAEAIAHQADLTNAASYLEGVRLIARARAAQATIDRLPKGIQ